MLATIALVASLATPTITPALAVDAGLWEEAAGLLAREQTGLAPALLDAYGPAVAARGGGAARGGVGIGLQVGSPTGITFKFPASGGANIVLDIGLGLGYSFHPGLSLHGDYLFTVASLVNNGTIDLTAYIGPGLWLAFFNTGYGYFGLGPYARIDYLGFGVRMPLGLNMAFATAPLEVFLELDPTIGVFPGFGGELGAALGFRWFF